MSERPMVANEDLYKRSAGRVVVDGVDLDVYPRDVVDPLGVDDG
jgi:ABC-type transporter Mla maintaining outer membrane lipid asymmetry ATPase subunit MlaF